MNAFFATVPLVFIAEMGDKTQLLSLILAARYRVFFPIIAGIFVATLVNHGVSAWAGQLLGEQLSTHSMQLVASLVFIAIGAWALKPDSCDGMASWLDKYGAFMASCIAFFLAEMGDKTQLATVALAAQYNAFFWVTAGSVVGMLAANIPAVLFGEVVLSKLPMNRIRQVAALAFIGFGVLGLLQLFYA